MTVYFLCLVHSLRYFCALFTYNFQGIKARVYETVVILALLAVLVIGLVWVASALFGEDLFEKQTSYGKIFS